VKRNKTVQLQMDGVDAEAVSSENNKKAAGAIRQPMKRVSEWTCRVSPQIENNTFSD